MLRIDQLSYWEKKSYFEQIDFLVIGAGIVGLSTTIYLRERYKNAKIVIIERGYLPTGASTKNAGFACFGSPTELYDDLQTIPEDKVWETVELRFRGLQRLFSLIPKELIQYQECGSWDLITDETEKLDPNFIRYINENTYKITGHKEVYTEESESINRFGFNGFYTAYKNRLEGSLHTNLLINQLYKRVISDDIHVLFGINADSINYDSRNTSIQTSFGEINAGKVLICTNGFANQFLEDDEVEPARAQVLITKPIANINFEGTFHIDKGYTYFRNIDNRILLGGGRNLNFSEERSNEFKNTLQIQSYLMNLLNEKLIPHEEIAVDYFWSGIMGIGKVKKPIIKKVNNNVYCGVRMGGMGVAIGSEVGYILANQV
ncbi:MAG TPA: FAD-dependent oxidoreductase [Crocinitomicaceae bacterium]|nr:FAD-dependent oxidoreductase [Crocinitomicaceae bacterium]